MRKIFKKSIAFKLTIYFVLCLLVFAMLIGGIYVVLFQEYTRDLSKDEMQSTAKTIASALVDYMSGHGNEEKGTGGCGGKNAFLKAVYSLHQIWIIDDDMNLILPPGEKCRVNKVSELPENAERLVKAAIAGKTVMGEGFSELQNGPTLTVATPIKGSHGGHGDDEEFYGVVLLHSPINGIEQAIYHGSKILFNSLAIAVCIAIALAVLLSKKFVRPLKEMAQTAIMLSDGNYSAKAPSMNGEDELCHLADSLNTLADRLEESRQQSQRLEKMRRDFIANVSHELKTPVTVIRGSLEALCDKVVTDEKQVEAYNMQMLKESKFLQRLIGDLLDLSKLQNVDFAIEKEKIRFTDVIEDAVRSMSVVADKKNIKIQIDNFNPDIIVVGDYGRLRQLIVIFLSNALKFSPEGSIIKVEMKGDRLSIADSGEGIEENLLDNIFERFHKNRDEQNKEGSGLGLAIAKEITARHGFDIMAENIKPNGARFTIIL